MATVSANRRAMNGEFSVQALLARAGAALEGSDSPDLDARLLLCHVLHWPTSRLWAYPDAIVPTPAARRFRSLVARRAAGEPVAYLLGEAHFHDVVLSVTRATLVPRPETEVLVERALMALPESWRRIADLGTGSGAVALALAKARPAWDIIAIDISPAALAIAKINRERLGMRNVVLVAGDWDSALADRSLDMIVANPPYVAADDPHLRALRHEPRGALVGGPTGLEALTEVISRSGRALVGGGWLLCEHGADQGTAVRCRMEAFGYHEVRTWRDIAGHERVTAGCRPVTAVATGGIQSGAGYDSGRGCRCDSNANS